MAKIDLKEVTLLMKDGTTPTANQVEIKVGEGTLTYTEARNMEYSLDRGLLDTVREGDQIPVAVSFDMIWESLKSFTSATPTPEEALKREGAAAAWVSSSSDVCEPYAIDIELTHDPVCDIQDLEQITISDFRWESIDHDVQDGTMSVSGNANVTRVTIVHLPQTT